LILRFLSVCFLNLVFPIAFLHAEKAIPFLSSPVIDDVGILTIMEKRQLSEYIQSQKNLIQMQVWITSLEGESIEGLSIRAAKNWALGTEKRDNGILMLIAPAERRMRIEVGRGLEGDIPDILAGRILDLIVRPKFRENKFSDGIREGLNELVVLASKGPQAEEAKKYLSEEPDNHKGIPFPFIVFFFLIIIFNLIFGRRRRGFFSSGYYGGGGWGGGGGSSGGSWSGGGGSFGGGGSSSSW
jgi:uncharacterized protein